MKITLNRCIVRSFMEKDASSISKYANNKKIWQNLRDAFPYPYKPEDAYKFIKMTQEQKPENIFAIEVENEACGAIGFKLNTDVERISAETGYWLAEKHWNRGILTEVLQDMTKYAMETFNLKRIYALPFEYNIASHKALEKAGFIMEGRMRKSAIKEGRVIDQFLYAYTVD